MYVRTRPKDHKKVVVTNIQAGEIDEEWSIQNGTHEDFTARRDDLWGTLNNKLSEHAQNLNWGLYRNTRFEMAEILRKDKNSELALKAYLEVCYLDLNGPSNCESIKNDPERLKEYPPFDPKKWGFLAPAIIDFITKIGKQLGLGEEDLRRTFLEHNKNVLKEMGLPLSPETCWEKTMARYVRCREQRWKK